MDEIDEALPARQPADDEPVDDAWADDEDLWAPPEDCTDEELGLDHRPLTAAEHDEIRRERRRSRERWRRLPDDPVPAALTLDPESVGDVLRAARGHSRLNQRELAGAAGMPRSAVSRAETSDAGRDMRLSSLVRLLEVCGLRLAVVDDEGTQLTSEYGRERLRDGADRHLPAHLAVYAPDNEHRSRYRHPHRPGPARVTSGRRRMVIDRSVFHPQAQHPTARHPDDD